MRVLFEGVNNLVDVMPCVPPLFFAKREQSVVVLQNFNILKGSYEYEADCYHCKNAQKTHNYVDDVRVEVLFYVA